MAEARGVRNMAPLPCQQATAARETPACNLQTESFVPASTYMSISNKGIYYVNIFSCKSLLSVFLLYVNELFDLKL